MFGSKKKALEQENASLRESLTRLGADELFDVQRAIEQANSEVTAANQELARIRREEDATRSRLSQLNQSIISVQSVIDIQETGLYLFEHPAESSVALGDQLKILRAEIKQCVKDGDATSASTSFTFNNSAAQGRKFVKNMSKLFLNAYNAEAENCVKMTKAGNAKTAIERLRRMSNRIEKNGDMINLRITPTYRRLREQEIELASRHLEAVKQAKEAEREERARLREEKKAQQELQKERERLEKEHQHYLNALAMLGEADSEEAANIKRLLAEVEKGIKDVDYRQANVRAGYVYVISNIGAFGPNMIKIGMTRRLDPMDRVRELGDASVPFGFDVHALFFSEDAVGVEAELHRRFASQRVNKVNLRREYFYATPTDVKRELADIAGALLEFVAEPEAEQFRLSQAMATSDAS